MRFFSFLLTLLLVLAYCAFPAQARTYRIVAVGDYGGNGDLSDKDADIFDDYMGTSSHWIFWTKGNGWTKAGDFRDSRATISSLQPERKIDYLYFTGHGSPTFFSLAQNGRFYPQNLGRTSNLKHLIGACCLTGRNTDWFNCFGNGLKSVLAYREVSFDVIDRRVAKNFAKEVAKVGVNDSYGHVMAWARANNIVLKSMKYRWVAYAYDQNNALSRFFIDRPAASGKKLRNTSSGLSLPDFNSMELANGRVIVSGSFEDSRPLRGGEGSNDDGGLSDIPALNSTVIPVSEQELNFLSGASLSGASEFGANTRSESRSFAGSSTNHPGRVPVRVYDLPGNGTALISGNGAVYMSRPLSGEATTGVDDTVALDQAMRFIEQNGGLPSDAAFGGIDRIRRQDQHGNTVTVGHVVSFDHEIDGIRASAVMGDGITVTLAGDEVVGFYRSWNQPGQPLPAPPSSIAAQMSVRDMIVNAQHDIANAIKGGRQIRIIGYEPGYHSPSGFDDDSGDFGNQTGFRPVIRLLLDDGGELALDAETGKLVW